MFKIYGIKVVINMDETFLHTQYNYRRVLTRINESTCEVVRCSKFDSKEGTTIIATSMKNNEERIPLVIVPKRGITVSENKYEVDKNKKDELIIHSTKGWRNGELIIK